MSTLEAKGVAVQRDGRQILSGVSWRLSSGELQAVVGPNGSGKSTLLRAMCGIWPVSEGAVLLDGQPLGKLPRREISRRISFVPQETGMYFAFTVQEIVAMGRHPHRGRFARETAVDQQAVRTALERCDIAQLSGRLVNTLSGGERQRVLIARSLAVEPEFILLDEPTASLDVEHTLEILDLCRALAKAGQCVVLATHDLNAVARYAASVALVNGGRLVDSGDRERVLSPERLQQVFGIRAEVLSTSDGQPAYVFHRRERLLIRD
jgi:iron complex transport system ATP-binding protein